MSCWFSVLISFSAQITEVEKPKDKQEEKREAEKLAEKAPAKPRTMSEGADSDDDMDEVMLYDWGSDDTGVIWMR